MPRGTARKISKAGNLWCPRCRKDKHFTNFAIDRSKKCGRFSHCRKCCSITKGNKFQHHQDFLLSFVENSEVKAAVIKEGWARWGFFPALIRRLIEHPKEWTLLRCENNYYQHYSINEAIRRNARHVGVKVMVLHGENGVFIKLRKEK